MRGGEAEETQIFVDGIRVFTPYTPTANNIVPRGRYSPFLFKGITFSTGGYSVEYGQALSSVLLLNTIDEPDQEKTEVSFMTVGLGVGNTQIWGKNSLSINTSYTNLAPYLAAFPDRNSWTKPFQSSSGEIVYRHTFQDDSMLKIYGAFSYSDFDVIQEDINFVDGFRFGLQNRNFYLNSSTKNNLENNWKIETGLSFTNDNKTLKIINDLSGSNENSINFKLKLRKQITNRFKFALGKKYFITNFDENYTPINNQKIDYRFNNQLLQPLMKQMFFSRKTWQQKLELKQKTPIY